MAVGVAADQDADAYAGGSHSQGGQSGPALQAGALRVGGGAAPCDEVVHEPEVIEVGLAVELLPEGEELVPGDTRLGGLHTELDGHDASPFRWAISPSPGSG